MLKNTIQTEDEEENLILPRPKLEIKNTEITQLKPGLQSLEEERLTSVNLLKDSANHLFALMKNLNEKEPSEIMTACECAKQIQSLLRLQLEAYKLKKTLDIK